MRLISLLFVMAFLSLTGNISEDSRNARVIESIEFSRVNL